MRPIFPQSPTRLPDGKIRSLPFLGLRQGGGRGGAQSKGRKGSNFAAQPSGAIVQKPVGPNTYDSKNPVVAIWQPCLAVAAVVILGALELEGRPLVVGGGVVLAPGDYAEGAGRPANGYAVEDYSICWYILY